MALIQLLDRLALLHPNIKFSTYVDDIVAESVGTARDVETRMAAVGMDLCDGIRASGLRLSSSGKCLVLASAANLGKSIANALSDYGVVYAERAKDLGAGVAAGVRRNTTVQRGRWQAFRARLGKFAELVRAGLSPVRSITSGAAASFTYGDDVTGVSNTELDTRRRTVAAVVGTPTRGKDVDAVLAWADFEGRQGADPAFAAHTMPICRWAEAVWCSWCPRVLLQSSITKAKSRLSTAARPWSMVNGPAAAAVATAGRIGWSFTDATTIETDEGEIIELDHDPPVVVKRRVEDAVRRWRNRRMMDAARAMAGQDGDGSAGYCVGPLKSLTTSTRACPGWNRAHQAALQSAAVNAQWPQARLHKAQLADHPHCALCAAAGIPNENAAAEAVNAEPPLGTMQHRIATCQPTAEWLDISVPFGGSV